MGGFVYYPTTATTLAALQSRLAPHGFAVEKIESEANLPERESWPEYLRSALLTDYLGVTNYRVYNADSRRWRHWCYITLYSRDADLGGPYMFEHLPYYYELFQVGSSSRRVCKTIESILEDTIPEIVRRE